MSIPLEDKWMAMRPACWLQRRLTAHSLPSITMTWLLCMGRKVVCIRVCDGVRIFLAGNQLEISRPTSGMRCLSFVLVPFMTSGLIYFTYLTKITSSRQVCFKGILYQCTFWAKLFLHHFVPAHITSFSHFLKAQNFASVWVMMSTAWSSENVAKQRILRRAYSPLE